MCKIDDDTKNNNSINLFKWSNILESCSYSQLDEIIKKDVYTIDIIKLTQIQHSLKEYIKMLKSTGQNNLLKKCKKNIKRLKTMKKYALASSNRFIAFDKNEKISRIENYGGLIPTKILELINKNYFIFDDIYIKSEDDYNILLGKLNDIYLSRSTTLYCYISNFKNVTPFENEFVVQKKLYKSLRIKKFWKHNFKNYFIILFIEIPIFLLLLKVFGLYDFIGKIINLFFF